MRRNGNKPRPMATHTNNAIMGNSISTGINNRTPMSADIFWRTMRGWATWTVRLRLAVVKMRHDSFFQTMLASPCTEKCGKAEAGCELYTNLPLLSHT